MPGGYPYLGPAGALVQLPSPAPGYAPTDEILGGTHQLLKGRVRDRLQILRRYTLNWPAMSDDGKSTVRGLVRQLGPYRYLDPIERNMLTANQSNGTDDLRSTDGVIARFQGTVSSSATFARSGQRSIAWATGTALAATNRGIYLYNAASPVDTTWTAVRPSAFYACKGWLRTSAAVNMYAGFDYHDAAGAYLSTSAFGASTAISTSAFTAVERTGVQAPSNAAYAIPIWLNATTTGAAITVYADDLQMEEVTGAGVACGTWRVGVGTPLVAVESFDPNVVVADASLGTAFHAAQLVLLEL